MPQGSARYVRVGIKSPLQSANRSLRGVLTIEQFDDANADRLCFYRRTAAGTYELVVAASIGDLHSPVTVSDTASVDLTLAGQQISAAVLPAGVDHNSLANLTTGDPHTQYVEKAGDTMTGALVVQVSSDNALVVERFGARIMRVDTAAPANVGVLNGVHLSGFSDDAVTAKWNLDSTTGNARFDGSVTMGDDNNDLAKITGRAKIDGGTFTVTVEVAAGDTGTATRERGSDSCGEVKIVTGGAGIGTGALATVNFVQARPDTNYIVQLTPASVNASDLNWSVQSRLTSGFQLRANVAPGSGETLLIQFLVVEVKAP